MDVCALCKSKEKDDSRYGEFLQLKKEKLAVHYYCLYLTSNLCQNGDPDRSQGICGFMPEDIRQEVKRIFRLICCYCSKAYANIGCCEKKCRRSFHLVCGIKNGAENQFIDTYQSFCHLHAREVQHRPKKNELCCICYDNLRGPNKRFCRVNMLIAPCCYNGWFHKYCLQKFAKSAGYFFKCPLCNDTEIVRNELPLKGIFIPDRDAAWELEPNAFADLLERPNTCSATVCKSEGGRKGNTLQNPLLFCSTCGSKAIHKNCEPENIIKSKQTFFCNDCNFKNETLCEDDTDEEVDVCNDCDEPISDNCIESENNDSINKSKSRQKSQIIPGTDESAEESLLLVQRRLKCKNEFSDEKENKKFETDKNLIKKAEDSDSDDELESSKYAFRSVKERKISNHSIYDSESDDMLETTFECLLENKKNIKLGDKLEKQSKDPIRGETLSASAKYGPNNENAEELENIENPTFLNVSCIANRTRRKSIRYSSDEIERVTKALSTDEEYFSKSCFEANTIGDKNREELPTTSAICEIKTKSPEELQGTEISNFLNVSCVANRTRRKSIHYSSDEIEKVTKALSTDEKYISELCSDGNTVLHKNLDESPTTSEICKINTEHAEMPQNIEKANFLDVSCIANRTRRKSICYSSDEVRRVTKNLSSDAEFFSDELYNDDESETYSNANELDISCIARRTRKRTSMDANNNLGRMDMSCIAKRLRKRTSMNSPSSIQSSSIGQQSTSWSSTRTQTPSTSNSQTSYQSCLSVGVNADSIPSSSRFTSNSQKNVSSNHRTKVFTKRKHCSTLRQPRRYLSSSEEENYVIPKIYSNDNILRRNFCNENNKCPMRFKNMYAYIGPEFKHVNGQLKSSTPTNVLITENPILQQQNKFKSSFNFLVGSAKVDNNAT